jgi:hypothetical protein
MISTRALGSELPTAPERESARRWKANATAIASATAPSATISRRRRCQGVMALPVI